MSILLSWHAANGRVVLWMTAIVTANGCDDDDNSNYDRKQIENVRNIDLKLTHFIKPRVIYTTGLFTNYVMNQSQMDQAGENNHYSSGSCCW